MIDEKAIEAALDAAFEVAEQLEAILVAARQENRRNATRERIAEKVVPGKYTPQVADVPERGTYQTSPPPEGEVWMSDLSDELQISDSQFYVWARQGHIKMIKRGHKNTLPLSEAWRLREIVAQKPSRFQTNARWVSAHFRGVRS